MPCHVKDQSTWDHAAFLEQQLQVCKQLIKEGDYTAAKAGLEDAMPHFPAGLFCLQVMNYLQPSNVISVSQLTYCVCVCRANFWRKSHVERVHAACYLCGSVTREQPNGHFQMHRFPRQISMHCEYPDHKGHGLSQGEEVLFLC